MRPSALTIFAATALAVAATTTPAHATVFTAPVVVTSNDLRDPVLRIAPDGTLYVGAAPGLPLASTILRSTNGGSSWTVLPPGMRASFPGGQQFDLTVDSLGHLATTDSWGVSSTVATLVNNTWTAQPFEGEVAQDRPWVAAAGGNVVRHVSHVPGAIVLATSTDGGLTYPTRAVVADDATRGCVCPSGNVVADGSRFAVVYSTATGINVFRSANGVTSTTTTVDPTGGLDTTGAYPVIAHAGGDVLAVAWLETGPSTSRIRFSRSTNYGVTWSAPVTVVSAGASAFPWIAARGSHVGISLYHAAASNGPWYESYVESVDTGSTWSSLSTADATAVTTGSIGAELGTVQTVAFDGSNKPNLAYVRSLGGSDTEIRWTRGA